MRKAKEKVEEPQERYFFFGDLRELTDIVSETELRDNGYENDFLTEVFIGDKFELKIENVIKIERIKS